MPLAASLLIAGGTRVADAQARPNRGAIDGIVTDTVQFRPLGNATISIAGSNVRVVTGANGRFRMIDIPPGQYDLLALRLGYSPTSARVQMGDADTLRVSFSMQRVATALDTVAIKGNQLSWGLNEFEERRKLGEGQFMAQAEIEKRNVERVSDLLVMFRGIKVGDGGSVSNRRGNGSCPPQVYLNGIKLGSNNVNDATIPKELAGIEVYLGPATTPLQYKSTNGAGFCGVILLWTRVEHEHSRSVAVRVVRHFLDRHGASACKCAGASGARRSRWHCHRHFACTTSRTRRFRIMGSPINVATAASGFGFA